MSDIPFWSGGSGGGTGGVSNYDKLSNKPVTNISGSGIELIYWRLQYRRNMEDYPR